VRKVQILVGYFTVFLVSLSRWLLGNGGGLGGGGLVVALGTRKQGQVTPLLAVCFHFQQPFLCSKTAQAWPRNPGLPSGPALARL
jgi:hypothetical protein